MVPENKINILCKFSLGGNWNFTSDICFPPNDVLGTFSKISEVIDNGKPGPPALLSLWGCGSGATGRNNEQVSAAPQPFGLCLTQCSSANTQYLLTLQPNEESKCVTERQKGTRNCLTAQTIIALECFGIFFSFSKMP